MLRCLIGYPFPDQCPAEATVRVRWDNGDESVFCTEHGVVARSLPQEHPGQRIIEWSRC